MAVGREAEDSDEETVVEAEVISSDDDSDQDAKLPAKEPDEAPDERVAYYEGCLLYTSPSPRDLSTSRMPSSA